MIALVYFVAGLVAGFITGISLYPLIFKGDSKK